MINIIILLSLIAFSWYLSGLMADSYALKKRIRELEKTLDLTKLELETIIDNQAIELNYYQEHYG